MTNYTKYDINRFGSGQNWMNLNGTHPKRFERALNIQLGYRVPNSSDSIQ